MFDGDESNILMFTRTWIPIKVFWSLTLVKVSLMNVFAFTIPCPGSQFAVLWTKHNDGEMVVDILA